jgi:peptide/nickel transport system permease protein
MGLVYVALALNVPTIIVAEAWLSFLGLGDPSRVTWGKMIFEAEINHALTEFNWILPPGICIGLISLSFVLIGYSLDEILNPRLRKR